MLSRMEPALRRSIFAPFTDNDQRPMHKTLMRSAKLMDVSAAFAMEEMKRTTELPLSVC